MSRNGDDRDGSDLIPIELADVRSPRALDLSLDQEGPGKKESWGKFKKRIMCEIQSQLEAVFKETQAARQVKPKRTHRKKRNLAHYRWFVLYQCAGWKYSEIAEAEGMKSKDTEDESTVGHGVRKVAAAVGVTLREISHQKTHTKFLP